jgi:prepilin-type N-terminal cleavage/methylation domain-containing protein
MKKNQGFTLVELIVAIGIFLSVVAIASGIFIRSVRTQRFIGEIMAMNSNASLALEQIMREIRSGFDLEVTDSGSTCGATLGDTLTFTRARNNATTTVIYRWDQAASDIERTEKIPPATILTTVLTAADVNVSRFCFSVSQIDPAAPWRLSLFLQVGSRDNSLPGNTVNLQTTVSARILPSEAQ